MKEHPILFSGPMVRAILNGCKTQTRRVAKGRVCECGSCCPYGKPGDLLWVRESFRLGEPFEHITGDALCRVYYAADDASEGPMKPSIHMPRWASRILLEVVSVRAERLQDISEEDARAEGVHDAVIDSDTLVGAACGYAMRGDSESCIVGPTHRFAAFWDSINAKRDSGWDVNPWVWVREFKRVEASR